MKNITVSVDDDTWRRSRALAARLGTSLPALVRGYLSELARRDPDDGGEETGARLSECDRRRDMLNHVLADFDARGVGLHMSDNLPRDALYDRNAPR